MADDKNWVTINGAHVPIEDGKPQFGGSDKSKSEARAKIVDRLKNVLGKKRKNALTFKRILYIGECLICIFM